MPLDQTRANQILDAVHGNTTLVAVTTPMHSRLMTSNGTSTANGTEVATGGGYTSGTGAPTFTWAAASAGSSASNSAITVSNYPRAETVVGVEQWDSNATPKRQSFGALTASKTMNAGDTFTIASAAWTEALA